MEWLNVHVSTVRDPAYVGSPPVERATWLNLITYCAEQENGGRIVGAKAWKDRQWQQTCGVTKREVNVAEKLLQWEGEDLIVFFYPMEKEDEVKAKREGGRAGGVRSGQARTKHSLKHDGSTASPDTRSTPSTEGKGKEGEAARISSALIPTSLQTAEFAVAWDSWQAHWSQTFGRGRAMPLQTEDAQLRELIALGPKQAVAAIRNSIAKGNLSRPAVPFASKADVRPDLPTTIISAKDETAA
jgi:hypothetical protein